MPSTPKSIGRSIGMFAIAAFAAAFCATGCDFLALFLLALAGGIINKQSVRCGVIAQVVSVWYVIVYVTIAVGLFAFPGEMVVFAGVEDIAAFRVVALPVLTVLTAWALFNAVAINRFVKGRTMEPVVEDPAADRSESSPAETV
jgi:hypothetical protein